MYEIIFYLNSVNHETKGYFLRYFKQNGFYTFITQVLHYANHINNYKSDI